MLIEGVERFALSFDGSKLLYEADGGATATPTASSMPSPTVREEGGRRRAQSVRHAGRGRSSAGVEADVQRSLAPGARLLLRGLDERRGLAKRCATNTPQLLPYVADRYSLTYILGEMIGELSNSHTYVGGGDYPDCIPVSMWACWVRTSRSTRPAACTASRRSIPVRIGTRSLRSPLTEPGRQGEGRRLPDRGQRPLAAGPAESL